MRVSTKHYVRHTVTPDEYHVKKNGLDVVRPFRKGEEFELVHEPVEDSITVTKTAEGWEVRYLVQDEAAEAPEGDDNAFLVHYHRDFHVTRDNIVTRDDIANWYRKTFDDYGEWEGCEKCDGTGVVNTATNNTVDGGEAADCPACGGKGEIFKVPDDIPQAAKFWIFPVAAYIHSGVALSMGSGGHFPDFQWDVSHVGAVLLSKEEWPEEGKAQDYARGVVGEWNQFLSGDVYGIVRETYDKLKRQQDENSCWGFFGRKWAEEALRTEL